MKVCRLLIILFLLGCFGGSSLSVEAKEKVSEEIKRHRNRLERIERRLIQQRRRLWKVTRREKTIIKALDILNRKIYKTENELNRIRRKLSWIKRTSKNLEEEMLLSKKKLEQQNQMLGERLRVWYRFKHLGYLEAILTASDFTNFIRCIYFIRLIAQRDAELINSIKENIKILETKKRKLLAEKRRLERLKNEEEKIRRVLDTQRRSRRRLLARIRESKLIYLSRIKELESASKGIKRLIERLEAKKRGLVVVSPRILALKGDLSWPVEGKVAREFGSYIHPKFNTEIINKGIHIKAPYGQKVVSVLDGKVVFADYFKGYGRLVMIDHGGGLYSLYAYLSDIFVQRGDFVKKGFLIGSVGEDENQAESYLHFELRINGEPINPLEWLKKRR